MSFSELHAEIDRAFGEGPAPRPVEDRINAGHKALARRRVASGFAALAVVAALGGAAWAVGPGDDPAAGGTLIATDPTPTVEPPSPSPTESAATEPWQPSTPVRYVDGELQVRPGVVVHERIENPYDYAPPETSVALDLTFKERRMWVIAEHRASSDGLSLSEPSNGWASFADYVADQAEAAGPGDDGWPDTVRLTARGKVVATPGSEILQRTDDPRLGESFAPAGTPTGAALVRAAADDFAYFVVWRLIDGELDVLTTPPNDVVGATFEEMLSYARSQYASGEGLR